MTPSRTRRLGLTLTIEDYRRVAAYAHRAGRPVATVAKRIVLDVVEGRAPHAVTATAITNDVRVRELEAEVTRLAAELDQVRTTADLTASLPRWRWPLEALLADRAWWDEWLPRLGELIGRHLDHDRPYGDRPTGPVVDERGYADLMLYLFPPVRSAGGGPVPWHSTAYPEQARRASEVAGPSDRWRRPIRAEAWEPVVRHVALALTAMETTSQAVGDAYAHLRVQAEIHSGWLLTLGVLLGEDVSSRRGRLPSASLNW